MGKLAIVLIAAIIAITLAIATSSGQATVKCPYPTCKKPVAKTATSCKHCKKKFVTCQKCKRPNAVDSNFCIYGCGKLAKPTKVIVQCLASKEISNPHCPRTMKVSIPKEAQVGVCTVHKPPKPEPVREIEVCADTNMIATRFCKETIKRWVPESKVPSQCNAHNERTLLRPFRVGDTAPLFAPDYWINESSRLKGNAGRAKVIVFIATWCGPSRLSLTTMSKYAKEYGQIADFYGLLTWEGSDKDPKVTREVIISRARKYSNDNQSNIAFHLCTDDPANSNAKRWMDSSGQSGIPVVFVVNSKNVVTFIGHPQSEDLARALAGLKLSEPALQ